MKKKSISLVFIAVLLLCAVVPLAQGATHVSVTWGSSYHPYSPYDPAIQGGSWFSSYEKPAQIATTNYITSLVSSAGPNWIGANQYGSNTMSTNVYNNSRIIEQTASYDFLSTFHVGDFYPKAVPVSGWMLVGSYWDSGLQQWMPQWEWYNGPLYHYAYYSDDAVSGGTNGSVVDMDLVAWTGAKHKFTFIWTCANGWVSMPSNINNYYYIDGTFGTGVVGMPYAWTQKSNLSTNGYTSPDYGGVAYIGFENTSKYLSDNGDFYYYNYGDFISEFYKQLYVYHCSVNTALNNAAFKVSSGYYTFWGLTINTGYIDPTGTGNTCRMRVLGDGNMVLPY